MTRPSTKLRANGNYIDNINNFPFVLRLSKHERFFTHAQFSLQTLVQPFALATNHATAFQSLLIHGKRQNL